MTLLYSKRLLWPSYIGVVQVADLDWARALSLDGKNWALRYAVDEDQETRNGPLWYDPRVNCSLVVTINGDHFETRADPDLSYQQVQADSQKLHEALGAQTLPFAAADHYEYWLLDGRDQSPLALLYSCVDAEEMALPMPPPEWRAMPAAELAVPDPRPADPGTPPVNYRLGQLVAVRAGSKPQAAWFQRTENDTEDFPPLLLREEWDDDEAERLCQLYLRRLAPRLLMLSGLPQAKRQWLEQAARENAQDVERIYRLYPREVDQSFINAARVEARMHRATRT
jgi:hypothetical protein